MMIIMLDWGDYKVNYIVHHMNSELRSTKNHSSGDPFLCMHMHGEQFRIMC